MMTFSYTTKPTQTDCLIIPLYEDVPFEKQLKRVDPWYHAHVADLKDLKDFEGKKLQMSVVYTEQKNTPRALFIGMGKKKEATVRSIKQVAGAAILFASQKKLSHLSVLLTDDAVEMYGAERLATEAVVAMEMANYAFDEYKSPEGKVHHITHVAYLGELTPKQTSAFKQGIKNGQIIAGGVNFTRHLGNVIPSVMTPTLLAKQAQDLAKQFPALKVRVLSRPDMKKLGMGCLLGVASGSAEEPKFIILEYFAGKKSEKPTVLVGKGITFDSGGLSLKPADFLNNMKFDMLGAATVLGTMKAAAGLKIKKNIVGLIPTCENMPGGEAYRPDDILVAMNGRSVEIGNTDAEGRLILADALSYAGMKYTPKEVIDFATLTGACMVALGLERSGLFTPVDSIAHTLLSSAEETGEQLWRLPLGEEYSEAIKSEVADISNVGAIRYGGASQGGAFLQFFTLDSKTGEPLFPWAHIDLSCAYLGPKGKPWVRGGASGFGVQMMLDYLNR